MAQSYNPYYNEYHQNLELQQNIKYKKKYRKLKRIVKDTVFENAALCDQVAQMQENLLVVKEERHFLLRKLYQQQGEVDPTMLTKSQTNSFGSPSPNHEGVAPKKSVKKRNSTEALETKSKPKRYCKAMRRVVQLIPLDIHGRPVFPISLGDLTVYSLGEVVSDRIAYHTEDLIYPVGYCSTRMFASLRDAHTKSLYTCKILDGGSNPRFEIVSDSDPDQPLVGLSPDECHSRLLAAISPTLCSIPPRGADFFGISHPTIQNLIQSSPGTRKLANYKSVRFEVYKNQNSDRASSPIAEEETDPGLGFSALHRTFAIPNGYRIKEEPPDPNLLTFQDFLM
ncbi:transforming growth factor beta regulator 1-like [Neodiprion pinetum]|uniref:Transforming growth factor beta regulator 1 n=1 Tax=Neodiprion lecontei TaxID=441921 RepID=A0A6J0BXN1_NEOLC|nr:transforming growth factor beta regulator 1 [Neodiprion lecontei]XP_046417345.1 transforming growth factor beta regulator 1 [Neodiprion fabricii]XP_046471218.1 transforming growth factor beta regulator 1-like [Neodiprion pinetum]XP_046471219.1 transforming growth factor beta regulator 1-like [Neodiprion pinetum]XP_046471220.1 transforming growth factor beta regulator 1-like [Neodiprion pinetum]